MPGTPPVTPRLGIPRWDLTDGADFPAQYNAGVDQIDKMGRAVVSALPGGPFYDGQEIVYKVAGDNAPFWVLRYDSAVTDQYKWRFIGGGPMIMRPGGLFDIPASNDTKDPLLRQAAPVGGVYDISSGVPIYNAAGTGAMTAVWGLVSDPGMMTSPTNPPQALGTLDDGQNGMILPNTRLVVPVGDSVVAWWSRGPSSAISTRHNGYLSMTPFRVG